MSAPTLLARGPGPALLVRQRCRVLSCAVPCTGTLWQVCEWAGGWDGRGKWVQADAWAPGVCFNVGDRQGGPEVVWSSGPLSTAGRMRWRIIKSFGESKRLKSVRGRDLERGTLHDGLHSLADLRPWPITHGARRGMREAPGDVMARGASTSDGRGIHSTGRDASRELVSAMILDERPRSYGSPRL
jgi:hypothetical protein